MDKKISYEQLKTYESHNVIRGELSIDKLSVTLAIVTSIDVNGKLVAHFEVDNSLFIERFENLKDAIDEYNSIIDVLYYQD